MSNALLKHDFSVSKTRDGFEQFVRREISKAVDAELFPGGIFGVCHPDWGDLVFPFGNLDYGIVSSEVTHDTLYDVASVTKMVPTSMLLLRLINQKLLSPDDLVQNYLPFFKGKYADQVTIRHVLSFAYDRDIPVSLSRVQNSHELKELLFETDLRQPPGLFAYRNATSFTQVKLIEKLYDMPYREAAQKYIFEPLGINPTFSPDPMICAPTEDCSLRGGVVMGEVHDEFTWNLKRLTGEDSGASGLFMSAKDAVEILRFLVGKSTNKSANSIFPNQGQMFGEAKDFYSYIMNNQLNGVDPNSRYGLGVDLLHKGYGPCDCCEKNTLAITGFSGCAFLAQPYKQRGFFLITNAIHPYRKKGEDGRNPLYDLRKKIFYAMQTCKHCFA